MHFATPVDFGTARLAEELSSYQVSNTTRTPRRRAGVREVQDLSEAARPRAMTQNVGTPLWVAPEILAGQDYGAPAGERQARI